MREVSKSVKNARRLSLKRIRARWWHWCVGGRVANRSNGLSGNITSWNDV